MSILFAAGTGTAQQEPSTAAYHELVELFHDWRGRNCSSSSSICTCGNPAYGTSYVTGKYLLERTLADYAKLQEERGEEFVLREFFDELNAIDNIPISLGRWQMTGLDDDIRNMTE